MILPMQGNYIWNWRNPTTVSWSADLSPGPPSAAGCRYSPSPLFPSAATPLCYYETFFQVQFKEQDFYLERGYFDLLEWLPETVPLHQYLERGQFNQLIYKVYQNTSTYSLEQLCEIGKENQTQTHTPLE